MTTLRKIFTTFAPVGISALLFVGSASADTIYSMVSTSGNISAFTAPGASTTSAGQFNQTAVNAAIQAGCSAGYICSAATLYEIDFSLTANLSSTVVVANTTGSIQYVGAIGGQGGTFAGGATSGVAVASVATLDLSDALGNDIVTAIPTFSIATNTRRKVGCASGTATSGNFSNCLSVANGSQTFSGTGTDTKTGLLQTSDGSLGSAELAAYVGTGNITFNLALNGVTQNGSLPAGVTVPTNIANVQSLANGLNIQYLYSYTSVINESPEPSTMALFGTALVGLGLFGRNRKKNA
jgi:hypothetical protein